MFYSTINLPAAINANAIVRTQYALAICFGETVTDKYYSKMEKMPSTKTVTARAIK